MEKYVRETEAQSGVWNIPNLSIGFEILMEGIEQDADKVFQEHCELKYELPDSGETQHAHYFSPFDIFHYFNTSESSHTPNSSEHIDPGFMTVVPCSPTPGLEIFDCSTGQYVDSFKGKLTLLDG